MHLCIAADEGIFNGPLGKMMGALSGQEEYGHMTNELQANLASVIDSQDPQAIGRLHMEVFVSDLISRLHMEVLASDLGAGTILLIGVVDCARHLVFL
jgi:hypothetical protein